VDLPDARKLKLSELYDYITTANPSPTGEEFIRFGYADLVKAGVITVDTSGLLQWGTNASGQKLVVEDNSSNISTQTGYNRYLQYAIMHPHIEEQTSAPINNVLVKLQQRVVRVPYTLAGGVLANVELVPALAGFYGVIDSILILPHDAIAPMQMAFECPAATSIEMVNVTLVADTINDQMRDYVIHGNLTADASDNDAIVVDLSGGAGAETGVIIVTYHYET